MASSSSSNRHGGKILKRANPATIQDKFLVGYQGWFTCGGDGEPVGPGHHGWLHWMNAPIPDGGHPNVDLWPDVSSYSPSELFPVPGLKTKTGDPVFLYSSRNPKTVQRHFHWMAEHGVDGAFLQRFVGQCDLEAGNEGIMRIRDEVGDVVKDAAEREGRVFAIMYDVVGVPPERILKILQRDWMHLIRNKGILDSPNYLKEKGKPVVALWGFGFDNAKHTPELVRSVVHFFRNTTPGGVYIMAGTPANWRTSEGDADPNPEFLNVWLDEFDAISPWTVGRYSNDQEADNFMETKMKGDVELINHRNEQGPKKIDYIPVVLPGGSGFNTSEGRWGFNNIKRNGGRFLWKQIANAKRLGVRTMYGAMWDEYDEGTALMPAVEHKSALPESDKFRFMALDEDGYDVPSDWYMRVCGFAAEGLRGERRIFDTFPVKELQDYWSCRPKYEEVSHKSAEFVSGAAGGSGDGDGQTYQEWLASQKDEKDEAPPPPYTLISDDPEPTASTSAPAPIPAQAPVHAPAPASGHASVNAPAPAPIGASRPGPDSAPTAASAPAPVPGAGVASITSTSPPASHTGSTSFNNTPSHPQTRPVSGYGNEAQSTNNAMGGYTPQSYPPGAAHAGGAPAGNAAQQSYYPGGGAPPPGAHTNEARHSGAGGYGAQSYHPNTSPNAGANTALPQQSYYSPPGGAPQQGPNQATYAPGPHQSGPGSNVPGGSPPQTYNVGHSQGASSGASASYLGGPPPGTPASARPQQPYGAPDPVASLANDFGRQNISGAPPLGAHGGPGARPGASPPPVHPAHPSVNQPGTFVPPSGYPSNAPRPQSQHASRPQSVSYAPPSGAPLHNASSSAAPQWPPKDWNVNQAQNTSGSPPPPVPHSTHPPAPQGGANLSRPGTFSASGYGGASGASLRPSASVSHRPSSRPPAAPAPSSNYPGSYRPGSSSGAFPSTQSYSVPSQTYGGGQSPFPQPHPSAASYNPSSPSSMNFPGGPSAPYPPSMSSYAAPGGSAFPGSPEGSNYGSSGPSFAWPGGPSGSPPPQPGASFPGADSYNPSRPYSPGAPNSSFPSTSPYPPAGGLGQANVGGHGFTKMPGASYPGSSMPTAEQSSYPSSYGPGDQYGPSSTYPNAGGSSFPSPSPWASGSGSGPMMPGGPPPPPPPRPANYSSNSTGSMGSQQGKPSSTGTPSFPMASNALGFALSAVDKVAGKKKREQLETQVGNLAQTGTKLFNKFTK